MKAAAGSIAPEQALAGRFKLRRNPFVSEAGAPDPMDVGNLSRLIDAVRATLLEGHLLTLVTGSSRLRQTEFTDRLAKTFGEEIRFLSLHGNKLSFSKPDAPDRFTAPAKLHQSIESIEFVVDSAIRQAARVERAGLLVDCADALDEHSLLTLLDFVDRFRSGQPPIQLVLIGTENILQALTGAACARFGELAARHFSLDRLTGEEARSLVAQRLERAGAEPELFPEAAVDVAHELANGYADALLGLALWALWMAGERGARVLTPELVREAAGHALGQSPIAGLSEEPADAGAYEVFHPGKLTAFARPTAAPLRPPARPVPVDKARRSRREGPAEKSGAPRRSTGWAIAAAVTLAAVALGWALWRADRSADEPRTVIATTPQPPEARVPMPAAERLAEEPDFEELPAIDPAVVDAPAFVDIESGEVRPERGDAPATSVADEPAPVATPDATAPEAADATAPEVADVTAPEVADVTAPEAANATAPEVADVTAPEVADVTAPEPADITAPEPAADPAPDDTASVLALLEDARRQFAQLQLTTPAGDNARESYLQVLVLDPFNSSAREGLGRLQATYIRWAESAERSEQWNDARIYYRRALVVTPEDASAAGALERLRERESMEPAPAVVESGPEEAGLLRAAREGDVVAIAGAVTAGAALDARDGRGKTPLMWAAQQGGLRAVRQLEARGADLSLVMDTGDTALMYAAQGGHADIVRYLIENGADVDRTNGLGWTALMYASVGGRDAAVRELLARGADVNALSQERKSPLMAAARNGHAAVVRNLTDAGARINQMDRSGWTALMYAAWQGHPEVTDALLESDAGLDLRNGEGQTALTLGIVRRHREVIDRLVQAGAQR